ncbi:MAG: SusC/RagA family TonB-linked outer membrane protein, partial [Tannerella sp.]|nr:SusC/RagA family TonB-linked outer membrane protein [Tannerella sp.]
MFLFICCTGIYATEIRSQDVRISLGANNVTVKEILLQIEEKTEFLFLYNQEEVDVSRRTSVNVRKKNVSEILSELFNGTDVRYIMEGTNIVLVKLPPAVMQPSVTLARQDDRRISGTVTDEKGEPIIGANIMEKGTTNGTVTDSDGNFSLEVTDNTILQVSYIGYIAQEISVSSAMNGSKQLIIRLIEDTKALEEVVVVGYGIQKKVNLTGAVSSVSSDVLNKRQVGQTSLALQGVAPGVTITQRNGQPGVDGGDIRIRGIGTLNNANPLILVDGLEMGLNNLDVNTIESISVLKDAASASIYGSKAANGVILVTTKRAQQGKFNIAYNGYIAQQSPTDLPEKVNAIDHILLLNESKINAGAGVVYTDEQINNWKTLGPSDRDHYPDADWQKALLQGSGLQQNHNLTLTGGTDKLKVLASLGYMGQDGIVKNVGFQRISLRLNTDIVFSRQFSSSL